MKKVFVTAIIIIGFAAAALGFGFFIGTKYPPALWIGIGGLVVGLGAYLIDGAIAYNETHGKPSKAKKNRKK